jgi:site-specific DNA-methyltransferase (adenine-specific)
MTTMTAEPAILRPPDPAAPLFAVTDHSLIRAQIRNAVLLQADTRALPIVEACIRLVVTSPPYNVRWPYPECDDDRPLGEYLADLAAIFRECDRVLAPGGVLAWNVPPTTRRPDERAFPLSAWCQLHLRETGWLVSEPVAWIKAGRDGRPLAHSTAFGAITTPYFRPTREDIIIAHKGSFRRETRGRWPDDSLEWVKDTWMIPPARAPRRGSGAPPPFPDELVHRLILLFSDRGDVVLDPFVGSGTTVAVAVADGRSGIGCDRSATYLAAAAQRVARVPLRCPAGRRCPMCSAVLGDGRRDRDYCSGACRQLAYRRRKAR